MSGMFFGTQCSLDVLSGPNKGLIDPSSIRRVGGVSYYKQ